MGVSAFGDGDLAAAERLMRRGLEVDPREPFTVLWLCLITMLAGREGEVLHFADRVRELSSDPFYVGGAYAFFIWDRLVHRDYDGAARRIREAPPEIADDDDLKALQSAISIQAGRLEEARRLLTEIEPNPRLHLVSLAIAAGAWIRLGDLERAHHLLDRDVVRDLLPMVLRLIAELHPLLDRPPFAPRRSSLTLVWPLEARMIDRARHALFREVRIESGVPRPGGFAA